MRQPFRLENRIMHYEWGSTTAIPELLGIDTDGKTPYAELWMGAHPKAPSIALTDGKRIPLNDLIAEYPEDLLGPYIINKFGPELPFLFKVLAASVPLSIQAHPDSRLAKEGFKRENLRGLPVNSPSRNYRDPRHKPECLCALEPFWALCGFREPFRAAFMLSSVCPVSLAPEISILRSGGENSLKAFFYSTLNMEPERKKLVIKETISRAEAIGTPEASWCLKIYKYFPNDIGIIAPFFLNLVKLQAGEAIFLKPQRLHSYLSGMGLELMANSDNVLRGGLTSKHIDKEELMRAVFFEPERPPLLRPHPNNDYENTYPVNAEEFCLSRIMLRRDDKYIQEKVKGPEILLSLSGEAKIFSESLIEGIIIKKGESVFIPALTGSYYIKGEAEIYKAHIP